MHEVIVPFTVPRASVPTLSHVRSTLIHSSQEALRAHGLHAAYAAQVGAGSALAGGMYAGQWLGVDVALAHYRACDALGLAQETTLEIGRHVSHRAHEIFAAVIVRLANECGASPWTVLRSADRLWMRSWRGSAVAVTKLGPKDAQIEVLGMPLADVPYFRVALRGFLQRVVEPFTTRAYAHLARHGPTTLLYKLQWA